MAEIEDQNLPVELGYSSLPDPEPQIRWWVVAVPFTLTLISGYVIFKLGNDYPYMMGIYARDFIEQVILGSMTCVGWVLYGVFAIRRHLRLTSLAA